MPIPCHPEEFWEYTLKGERDEKGEPVEGAATFFIGSIPAVRFSNLLKLTAKMLPDADKPGEQDYAIVNEWLKEGLRNWRWVSPATGNEVKFAKDTDGKPSQATLDLLPFRDALELMAEIQRGNTMEKPAEKNSVSE